MLRSEDGRLVALVSVDVAGRAIVDYVAEAKRVVAERVTLPPGTRLAWAGQFEAFERAKQRLLLVLPITLALVYLAVAGSIAAFTAYVYLLNAVRPALATSYAYVNPPVAVLLGVWLLGESFGTMEAVAMAVILGGVAIILLQKR